MYTYYYQRAIISHSLRRAKADIVVAIRVRPAGVVAV